MYESEIEKNADGTFYALVVRVDDDGEKTVLRGYNGKYFKSHKAAMRSTTKYIAKIDA